MLHRLRLTALGAALVLGGCAAQGGWMGAEAEKAYDKELEIKRLAEVNNNDDYYEFERDGRVHVLADAKTYSDFLKTGEIPYSTKKIGGGPGGRTIVYALTKNETKVLEKNPKAQGAAQKMYEGNLKGMEKNFFALVERPEGYYVFNSWAELQKFKSAGSASGYSENAPDGRKTVYAGMSSKNAETGERFGKLFAAK